MLLREESACQLQTCYSIGNDLSYNDNSCCTIQNKASFRPFVAVKTCSRYLMHALSLDDMFVAPMSNVLHCLCVIGLVSTSPTR